MNEGDRLLHVLGRIVRHRPRFLADGFDDDLSIRGECRTEMWDAKRDGNPRLDDAVDLLLALEPPALGVIADLAWLCRDLPSDDRVTARVAAEVDRLGPSDGAAEFIAELPPDRCTPAQLEVALASPVDDPVTLHRRLRTIAVQVEGAARAFERVVQPHLETATPESVRLLAEAYLDLELPAAAREQIRDHLLSRTTAGRTSDLVAVAGRLSIEHLDQPALDLVAELVERDDLRDGEQEILGFIVAVAGDAAEGLRIADLPTDDTDPQGWWTAGADSLHRYLRALDATPAQVLEQLYTYQERSISTVGAMVGRQALMRMRAFEATGDHEHAVVEARAVMGLHDYRGYDLHVQGWGFEFHPELVTRVAVTDDELAEARVVLGSDDPDSPRPYLHEGTLL